MATGGQKSVNIDMSDMNRLVDKLKRMSAKDQNQIKRKTWQGVGKIIRDEAVKNLRGVTKHTKTKKVNPKTGKKQRNLQAGITNRVWRNLKGTTVTNLGDYRLKWFEEGTEERYTKPDGKKRYKKKAKYNGAMKASHFLSKAAQSKKDEAIKEVENELLKSIQKVWDKNQKK
jgi:hypothetical protein